MHSGTLPQGGEDSHSLRPAASDTF